MRAQLVLGHLVARATGIRYTGGVGKTPLASSAAVSSSGGCRGRFSVREVSGRAVAVTDFIDLTLMAEHPLWPFNAVLSVRGTRALIRFTEDTSRAFGAILRFAAGDSDVTCNNGNTGGDQ